MNIEVENDNKGDDEDEDDGIEVDEDEGLEALDEALETQEAAVDEGLDQHHRRASRALVLN